MASDNLSSCTGWGVAGLGVSVLLGKLCGVNAWVEGGWGGVRVVGRGREYGWLVGDGVGVGGVGRGWGSVG